MKSALLLLAGIVLGAVGYATYRGDFGWERPSVSLEESAERSDEALPELPISLAYRENRSGRGYIVQVHNTSQKHLAVLVELDNPTLDQQSSVPLQLAPGEIQEIGEAQGWTFVSGESIRVRQEGYKPATLTIP
jgi:hypothetical protein